MDPTSQSSLRAELEAKDKEIRRLRSQVVAYERRLAPEGIKDLLRVGFGEMPDPSRVGNPTENISTESQTASASQLISKVHNWARRCGTKIPKSYKDDILTPHSPTARRHIEILLDTISSAYVPGYAGHVEDSELCPVSPKTSGKPPPEQQRIPLDKLHNSIQHELQNFKYLIKPSDTVRTGLENITELERNVLRRFTKTLERHLKIYEREMWKMAHTQMLEPLVIAPRFTTMEDLLDGTYGRSLVLERGGSTNDVHSKELGTACNDIEGSRGHALFELESDMFESVTNSNVRREEEDVEEPIVTSERRDKGVQTSQTQEERLVKRTMRRFLGTKLLHSGKSYKLSELPDFFSELKTQEFNDLSFMFRDALDKAQTCSEASESVEVLRELLNITILMSINLYYMNTPFSST